MLAEQFLPEEFKVKEIRVEYKIAAVLGDMMIPRVSVAEDAVTVSFVTSAGQLYAAIQFLGGK